MKKWFAQCLPLLAVPLMVACGGGSTGGPTATAGTSTAPGTLQYPNNAPLGQISVTAAQFKGSLLATSSGKSLYALATGDQTLAATLPCGVEVHKLEFFTLGGAAAPETVRSRCPDDPYRSRLHRPASHRALCARHHHRQEL